MQYKLDSNGRERVTCIAGDGLGTEVAGATRPIVEAAGVQISSEEREGGAEVFKRGLLSGLPAETIASIRETLVALTEPLEEEGVYTRDVLPSCSVPTTAFSLHIVNLDKRSERWKTRDDKPLHVKPLEGANQTEMSAPPIRGDYAGRRFSLLTQHDKEHVIGPLFHVSLGVDVDVALGFDTDTLGTFTRDVARPGSQLDAARKKAEKGMEILGTSYGIASEGSFGPDPFGLFPWDVEFVILIDRVRGIELVGRAQGPGRHLHDLVSTQEALEAFAERAGFPEHGLVVRADSPDDSPIWKGLKDRAVLGAAFAEALAQSKTGKVFVESDLRAHMNPTRMALIGQATQDLIRRMKSLCPRCQSPGFWVVERILGRPCLECGSPTNEACAERWACVAGDHAEVRDLETSRFADPQWCNVCNP